MRKTGFLLITLIIAVNTFSQEATDDSMVTKKTEREHCKQLKKQERDDTARLFDSMVLGQSYILQAEFIRFENISNEFSKIRKNE
jgi:hypothetical protein